MHDFSPLSPLDLRAIEDSLNAGDLEKAQQQLADLASHADLEPGATYLATRLLFLRGRLDAAGVVDRMRELVGAHPTFAEAREFMDHCRTALRTDGSVPPPGDTPRPRTLFPSAPPEASAPTTTLSAPPATAWSAPPAKPTQELKQGERSGPWSVPEVEETDLLDSDRPTVEPELGQSDQDGASLAPTEFPSALPSSLPSVSPDNLDRNSREIRVDTRQSYLPSSASLPPPGLYNPNIPRPVGRYSHRERPESSLSSQSVSSTGATGRHQPQQGVFDASTSGATSGAERSGRYRFSNISSDVIPIPLVAGKTLPRATSENGQALIGATAHRTGVDDAPRAAKDPARPFRVPRPVLDDASTALDEDSHEHRDPERQFIHDPKPARARLELRALELLEPYPTDFQGFDERSAELAALLSTMPVVHYFAPFDRSLCSLPRLELALRTLYSGSSALPAASVRPLLALYLGDVLRTSHRGTWRGTTDQPSTWAVEAGAHIWQPFRSALELFGGRPGHSILASLGQGLARRGTVAWISRAPTSAPLPKPWLDPLTPQKQTELGHWVQNSPWSVCCETLFGHALDGSAQSLKALDQLLDVLFDSSEAPRALDPWLTRAATLAGAYVGVVLGVGRTAAWVERESPTGERYLGVELPGGLLATPVVNIVARATSRKRSQLNDYVRALLRRAH